MKKYINPKNENLNNMFKNAINKKNLKKAMNDPEFLKTIAKIKI